MTVNMVVPTAGNFDVRLGVRMVMRMNFPSVDQRPNAGRDRIPGELPRRTFNFSSHDSV
jgi:hypothetical protein